MKDVFNLINICPTSPIQVLDPHGIFLRMCLCPSNDIYDIKKSMLVLGPQGKDRKYCRDKANIDNPKVNRGCPPLTANRSKTCCDQNSPGPSIQYVPLGVYHTGGFNAMKYFNYLCHISMEEWQNYKYMFGVLLNILWLTHILSLCDCKTKYHRPKNIARIDTLGSEQNGHHVRDGITKCIFVKENSEFWFKLPWSFLPSVELIIS